MSALRALAFLVSLCSPVALAACGDGDDDSAEFVIAADEWQFKGPYMFRPGSTPWESEGVVLGFLNIIGGDSPDFEIRNIGQLAHTFTIDELDIDEELQPGEITVVTFDRSGDFEYYCRFHLARDMRGSTSVTDTGD